MDTRPHTEPRIGKGRMVGNQEPSGKLIVSLEQFLLTFVKNDLEHMYKCALGLHQHHLVIADTHELVNNQFGTFIQWLRRNVLQGDTVYPLMVVVTKLDALTEHGHVNVRLKTAQKAIFGNPSKAGYEIDPTIRICSAEHYFGYVYLMEYLELFLSAQAANKKKGKGEMPDFEHLYSPHSPSNAVRGC